jgi:hypothetical protein
VLIQMKRLIVVPARDAAAAAAIRRRGLEAMTKAITAKLTGIARVTGLAKVKAIRLPKRKISFYNKLSVRERRSKRSREPEAAMGKAVGGL